MSVIKVIDFKNSDVPPVHSVMDPERRISGAPVQQLTNVYAAESNALLSGSWRSEAGKWRVDYSRRHEFCYLLEGKLVLTDAAGDTSHFQAGDAFVIPAGFRGSWEVVEPVVKHYVIYNLP